jgi:hypothetical protein
MKPKPRDATSISPQFELSRGRGVEVNADRTISRDKNLGLAISKVDR